MILEIDAGNTFIKWRIIDADAAVLTRGRVRPLCLGKSTPGAWLSGVDKVRVASVAGKAVNDVIDAALQPLNVSVVYAQSVSACAGVVNGYDEPCKIGVDRWLAMLAAFNQSDAACCVVDCGSAITIDYINKEGLHQGGFIMPGLRLMQEGLLSNTAEIVVDKDYDSFDVEPGADTSSAVSHGINYLFKSLAEKILSENEILGGELFITGGDGELFAQLIGAGCYRSELVLDGLKWSVGE